MSHLLSAAPGSSLAIGNFLLHSNHSRHSQASTITTASGGARSSLESNSSSGQVSYDARLSPHSTLNIVKTPPPAKEDCQKSSSQYLAILPSPHDILIGHDSHAGTKAFRIVVQSFIPSNQPQNLPPFTPTVYASIMNQWNQEHPVSKFYIITTNDKRGWKVATTKQKIDFVRACYYHYQQW
jgi:hypothetical protein